MKQMLQTSLLSGSTLVNLYVVILSDQLLTVGGRRVAQVAHHCL
jgi:hypothetical protein